MQPTAQVHYTLHSAKCEMPPTQPTNIWKDVLVENRGTRERDSTQDD